MIRKWSRIAFLSFDVFKMKKAYARYTYKSFRSGVLFKKAYFKKTRIKRNQYSYYKHLFNWTMYSQIWQHWIKDFEWNFYLTKFQYFKNFNEFEVISYNAYFFNNKKLKMISNYDNYVNCFSSKKLLYFFYNKNFKCFFSLFLNFFSYPLNFSTFNDLLPFPDLTLSTFPIIFNLENNFYNLSISHSIHFNLDIIFSLIQNLIIFQILELKKILIIFLFLRIQS